MTDETRSLHSSGDSLRQAELDDVLADCLRRQERGEAIDRDALLAQHPELAEELREFFANQKRFGKVMQAPPGASGSAPPTRLRYFGDYELLDEIAHGGMGVVYKARQTSLNRLVAVKMILAGQLANEEEVKRFQAEAEAAANLHHPGVVAIYEVGINNGQHYYSMEYVEGRDLAAVLRDKPVGVTQAAQYLREIAEIVEFAHSQGVLHRDLKPSNILIDGSDRLRITDFGLAKRAQSASDLTITGQVLGTPNYMSPEQAAAQHAVIGPASDVYSLGTILYELLTGRPPFRSENIGETLRQVQHEEPVRPRLLNPKLPRDLETICLKCLEKDSRRRYATAQLMADDLGRYLRGEPILARPIGAPERAWRWCRRKPAMASLAIVTVIASLSSVAAGVGSHYNSQLVTANTQLESAKQALEGRNDELLGLNAQLANSKTKLEQGNAELAEASTALEQSLGQVQAERLRANRYLYAARMALAQRADAEKESARVIDLLRSLIPETPDSDNLRGFEWHYLWRKHHGEQSRLRGHRSPVTAVVFSPDDRWIISGSADGVIHRWDAATGKQTESFSGHDQAIMALAIGGPDNQFLASASKDKSVRIWDWDTCKQMNPVLEHDAPVTALAFSRDGQRLVSGTTDGRVIMQKVSDFAIEAKTEAGAPVEGLVFHADQGSFVIGTSSGGFRLWNSEDSNRVIDRTIGCTTNVVLSPDGRHLLYGFNGDRQYGKGMLTIFDLERSSVVKTLTVSGVITCVAWNPDGKTIAAGSTNQSVQVWEAATEQVVATLSASDAIRSIAFNPSGTHLIAGTDDHLVMVWSLPGAETRSLKNEGARANNVDFGADGTLLGAVIGKEAVIWSVATGSELARVPTQVNSRVALAEQRPMLAGAMPQVLRHAISGSTVMELVEGPPLGHATRAFGCAFSADGKLVAGTSGLDDIGVWNVQTGKRLHLWRIGTWGSCAAFSPDGKLLAAGGGIVPTFSRQTGIAKGGSIGVWNLETEESVFAADGLPVGVWSLDFSPDGSRLAIALGNFLDSDAAGLGQVRLMDVDTWQVAAELRGHRGCVYSVAFDPSGTRLASAAGHHSNRRVGGEVKLWDVSTWQEMVTLNQELKGVLGVDFSPDGRYLATAAGNGEVKLWNGTPLAETPGFAPLPDVDR